MTKTDDGQEREKTAIEAAQAGDSLGLEFLVRKYRSYIYTIIIRNNIYDEEADELFQDVCLRLLENIKKYRQEFSFRNWLFTVTLNHVRNYLRRKRLKDFFFPAGVSEKAVENASSRDRDQLAADLLEKAVNRELAVLPPKYFQAIMLFYYEDKSYNEIASAMNVSEGTIKTWLFRAKNILRTKLKHLELDFV